MRGTQQHTPPAWLSPQRREALSVGTALTEDVGQTMTPGTDLHRPLPRLRPHRRETK